MKKLLYIHGFNSSERSYKASVMIKKAQDLGFLEAVISPRLSWQPTKAIAQLEAIIEAYQAQGISLIGSSLGGFYAAYLAEKYQIKSILVNPAVQAPILLKDYLGPQSNPYTNEYYELTQEHMIELEALTITQPTADLYWLMVQEGDEVLDYREALAVFAQAARLTHEKNGDHSFVGFERFATGILQFAGILNN